MRKWNVRVISFLLILVFSQKLGMQLWLHNWLHSGHPYSCTQVVIHQSHDEQNCSCIDDLTMPMTGAQLPVLQLPVSDYCIFIPSNPAFHYTAKPIFFSCGPPAKA